MEKVIIEYEAETVDLTDDNYNFLKLMAQRTEKDFNECLNIAVAFYSDVIRTNQASKKKAATNN